MSVFLVTATVRERHCDRQSAITALQLHQPYNGFTIHELKDLLELSRSNSLWVSLGHGVNPVRVEVFWSPNHSRYIARTVADTTTKNNLDHLPIVRPRGYQTTPGVTNYEACSI